MIRDPSLATAVGRALAPGLTVREAVPGDDDLLRALHAETLPPGLGTGPLADLQFEAQRRGLRAAHPDGSDLVVERDGRAIGRLWLAPEPGGLRIVDIVLAPEHRGRGAGRALVVAVQAVAADDGRAVRLHVAHDAPHAAALYADVGFVPDDGAAADPFRSALRWDPLPPG